MMKMVNREDLDSLLFRPKKRLKRLSQSMMDTGLVEGFLLRTIIREKRRRKLQLKGQKLWRRKPFSNYHPMTSQTLLNLLY